MNCKNCGNNIEGEFCSHCGQNSKVDRINFSNLLNEISVSVFQVDKGLFYTIGELFTRPGKSIRGFLSGKRKNHFKPVAYALLLSTLYFLITHVTNQNTWMSDAISGMLEAESEQSGGMKVSPAFIWFSNNYAYSSLLLLPLFSLASYISFYNFKTNYFEHIVSNSYVAGQQAILYFTLSIIGVFIENSDIVANFSISVSVLYLFWVFRKFFSDGSRTVNIFRTLMTYILYLIFGFILMNLIVVITMFCK